MLTHYLMENPSDPCNLWTCFQMLCASLYNTTVTGLLDGGCGSGCMSIKLFPPKLTMRLDLTENTYWTMFECDSTQTYNHIAAFSIYLGQIWMQIYWNSKWKQHSHTQVCYKARWEMLSLHYVLGLTWGHLLAGYVWNNSLVRHRGYILTRCLSHLSCLLLTWMSSSSTKSLSKMSDLLWSLPTACDMRLGIQTNQ